MREPLVISIGTTHPWNVAGIGLDLALAHELGVRVETVVVGVSAQDEGGVRALHAVPNDVVRAQFAAVHAAQARALRIGALTGAANVRAVAAFVRGHAGIPAVVDPVLGATRGGSFLDENAFAVLRDELATAPSVVVTPNLPEAARLLGVEEIAADGSAGAAQRLRARGARAVLVKGGHAPGEPVDVLADDEGVIAWRGERIDATMPGTGCALAMALAAALARGEDLRAAAEYARGIVRARLLRERSASR